MRRNTRQHRLPAWRKIVRTRRHTIRPLRCHAIGLAVAGFLCSAPAQLDREWVARYSNPPHDAVGASVAAGPAGDAYVAGVDKTSSFVLRYDAKGTQSWMRWCPIKLFPWDHERLTAADSADNLYVAGEASSQDGYCIIKYDAKGNQRWVRRYAGPTYGEDRPTCIALDGEGNVYVAGASSGSGTSYDFCTIKYDANGKQLWVQRYDGPTHGSDWPCRLTLDNKGNVAVTGRVTDAGSGQVSACTIRYDTDGNQLWIQVYDGYPYANASALDTAADGAGNVYLTGNRYDAIASGQHDFTAKYDANGSLCWLHGWEGDVVSTGATALAIDKAGNAFVAGTSASGGHADYLTFKFDADGNPQWAVAYDGPAHDDDTPVGIVVDGAGSAYVLGQSDGASERDWCTVKYDTDGNLVWLRRYDGTTHWTDNPCAIATDGATNVYVTGQSAEDPSRSMLTMKYARDGTSLTGRIQLEGWAGTSSLPGVLEYRTPGTLDIVASSDVLVAWDGSFYDPIAPIGTYDVACRVPTWLNGVTQYVTIGPTGGQASYFLFGGDANDDNSVNFIDLGIVLANYGSTGTTQGDLDLDGSIDLTDIGMVVASFGKVGAP
jgi:hypothetical protein